MESIFVYCYLRRVAATGSVLCIGLNPKLEYVPPVYHLTRNILGSIEKYLLDVIGVAARFVPLVKFEAADYLSLGEEGKTMLLRLIERAHHQGLLVILNANQEYIGKVVKEYDEEVFKTYGADACIFGPCNESMLDFSHWMEWLKIGHMVIPTLQSGKTGIQFGQDSELSPGHWDIEDTAAEIAELNAEVIRKTKGAGGIGIAIEVSPEQMTCCRKFAGDDVFFLISSHGAQACGAKMVLNKRSQVMGAIDIPGDIILDSWRGQSRKKRPLEPVEAAIKAVNANLAAVIERKSGKEQQKEE